MTGERDPIEGLLRKLRRRDTLSEREASVLRDPIERVEDVPAGTTIIFAGQQLARSTLLVDGFVSRFKDLSQGQRQITELHVGGDFVDLHGFLLHRLEHNIGALTPLQVAYVSHDRLREITEREPHLSRLLWLSTVMDAAIQRERILSIGRRPAVGRVAHLLCELYLRLEVVGLADPSGFQFPVTQIDVADATGLTAVHVNRMLRQLRDKNIVTFRGGRVDIHDLAALEEAAEFDRSYLFLESEPR